MTRTPAEVPPALAAIASLAGIGMGGGSDLLGMSRQLDSLAHSTGYASLGTFAQACRELHNEITRESGG